ncbi:MAG: AMP-binding protein [Actinomycetota bacterium]|nr:AMP-binding protein [Actinomycetota bacterium]
MNEPDPREEDLLSLLLRQTRAHGDRILMTFGDGQSMTFSQFERRVAGFRGRLLELGVGLGDRVGLMMKNSLFYPVAWLGVVTAGGVAVPMNSRLGEKDARYLVEHSGAKTIVADDVTGEVARSAARGLTSNAVVVRSGDPMAEFESDEEVPAPSLHGGTVANIQYTSGTTGFPKGCLLSHRYWQRMGAASRRVMGLGGTDILLTSQPHSYIDPQWQVIAALRAGAQLVLLDGFHPTTFMRDVARFGVTIFYCLGVMPTLLLKQPAAPHDVAHRLRRVYCSAIPKERHAEIEQRWGVDWFELFGMTETGVNTAVAEPDHDRALGTGCIGTALDHNEAMVVDEEDREVPPGRVGELVLRGLGLMDGYHADPEATAQFFRNGWAHTGDVVARDETGLLFYRGRRKEMIRRGGENMAPAEIEAALATHPDVIECAVAPVPDPDLGEEVKAYVVTRAGAEVDPADLAAHVRSRLAAFKVPRYWEFRASLPHTPSERVAKHELERGRDHHLVDTIDLAGR